MAFNASGRQKLRAGTGRAYGIGAFGRTLIAMAVSGSMITTLTPAIAQPANPDDASIAEAQAGVEARNGEVSRLAGSLSATDSEIDRLELEMGALREAVNKALVDLHAAQAEAERARQEAVAAKEDLDGSQLQIAAAQERLNEISRAAYRQNGTSKGLAGISGNGNNEDALDRQTYLRTTAEKQREAVEELDRLRTENANKESALREAQIVAEQREAEAAEQERQTRAAIDNNSAELSVLNANRNTLVAERDEAERGLAVARTDVDSLHGQRREFEEFQHAEEERKQAEAVAAAAAEEKRRSEEVAAAAEREAAAAQAAQQEANSQAEAQRKAEEARVVAEQARAEADQRATDDAEAQVFREQALAAASVAAAALIAASQIDHATTDNPYPSVEDVGSGDAPAAQGSNVNGPSEEQSPTSSTTTSSELYAPADPQPAPTPGTGVGLDDLEDITDGASDIITGDRATKIEAVISRAKGQIGTPYAWGGGDANGPTLGIRDGGVADSYGDYNKVGFDCSGLTVFAFAGVGIALPHYTGYQYQRGTKVSPSEMQRGDLIFYGPGASQHVAIYLGDGQMIEAPQSGSSVQISPVRWSGMTENAVRLI